MADEPDRTALYDGHYMGGEPTAGNVLVVTGHMLPPGTKSYARCPQAVPAASDEATIAERFLRRMCETFDMDVPSSVMAMSMLQGALRGYGHAYDMLPVVASSFKAATGVTFTDDSQLHIYNGRVRRGGENRSTHRKCRHLYRVGLEPTLPYAEWKGEEGAFYDPFPKCLSWGTPLDPRHFSYQAYNRRRIRL